MKSFLVWNDLRKLFLFELVHERCRIFLVNAPIPWEDFSWTQNDALNTLTSFQLSHLCHEQASSTWRGKKRQKFDFDICRNASNSRPFGSISALLFPWAIGCQRDLLFVIFIVLVIVFVIVFFIVIVIVAYMRMKPVESIGLGFFHLSKNLIQNLKISCGGRNESDFFWSVQCPKCNVQGPSKLFNPSADENYKVLLKTKILLR